MDIVMTVGFILFMIWIIKGYHAQKYKERYGDKGTEVKKGEEDRKERGK